MFGTVHKKTVKDVRQKIYAADVAKLHKCQI